MKPYQKLTAAAVVAVSASLPTLAAADEQTPINIRPGCTLDVDQSTWTAEPRAEGERAQYNAAIGLFGTISVAADNGTLSYMSPRNMREPYAAAVASVGVNYNGDPRNSRKAWGSNESLRVDVPNDTVSAYLGFTDAAGEQVVVTTDYVSGPNRTAAYTLGQADRNGVSWLQIAPNALIDAFRVEANDTSKGLAYVQTTEHEADCPSNGGGSDNNGGGKSESGLSDGPVGGGTSTLNYNMTGEEWKEQQAYTATLG